MIRAAFFDIDGTLLPHSTGRVPASAEQAVRRGTGSKRSERERNQGLCSNGKAHAGA